ncbi:F-box/kelch-repeat protein At3g06240-like [Rhododendron vialii]|uniref:F-box/kelch-repeat protein At3g06240-like n=1 Tax=Rhododendron vialii TaxID=182163 RepID=UPI00265FB431|nr:F-box/kelch-repeat protein At3g06240-like [Rhododendron vialii]
MGRDLPHIPPELIFNILSRLSVKSLCCFKSVSKPWHALITDRQFVKSHLNRQSTKDNKTQKLILACQYSRNVYSLDFQAPDPAITELQLPYKPIVTILGSLNGILLIRTGRTLRLWNPSIRMFQKFTPPDFPSGSTIYGLSYDSASDDFKVVMAIRPSRKNAKTVVHVFSARLSSWNRIGDFGYQIHGRTSGTVLNGAPHSVVERLGAEMGAVIVYFDATEEKFKEVPSPDCEGANILVSSCGVGLGVLGGSLCVVKRHYEGHASCHADVWVMKEYGVKESWSKLFVVPIESGEFSSYRCMPLYYANDGEVVMVLDSEKLVSYNPEENSYQTISIAEVRLDQFDVALYVESLASPHGGNEMKGQP